MRGAGGLGSRSAGALTERERRQQWVSLAILLAPWVLGFVMEAITKSWSTLAASTCSRGSWVEAVRPR